jgi:hypothetical protein
MLEQQIMNGLMLGTISVPVGVAFTLTIGVLNLLKFSLPSIFILGRWRAEDRGRRRC